MSDEGVIHFVGKNASPRSVLADALNEADQWEAVIVICKTKDSPAMVALGHSTNFLLEKIGMCEFAAHIFKENMKDG